MNDISWITAIHEAAHAVAAIRAGLAFENVSAEPDEAHELDGALYWTEIQDSGEIVMPPELLAVVSLAGPCAEARLRGQRFDRMFLGVAATDDRESVASLGLSEAQFLDACRETIELVEQDWALIEKIGHRLMAGGTLSYGQVEAIVVAEEGGDAAQR